jgi:hypothetical protein
MKYHTVDSDKNFTFIFLKEKCSLSMINNIFVEKRIKLKLLQ